jgi:DNA-binding response OmpR family regulator
MLKKEAKILAVEDDDLTQKMLRLTLSKYFDIDVCGNNTEFYEITLRNDYDLVLMDISLRDLKDGCELTKELRKSERFKGKPIIALTSFISNHDRQKAYDAGVDLFLAKPILPNELVSRIRNFIK